MTLFRIIYITFLDCDYWCVSQLTLNYNVYLYVNLYHYCISQNYKVTSNLNCQINVVKYNIDFQNVMQRKYKKGKNVYTQVQYKYLNIVQFLSKSTLLHPTSAFMIFRGYVMVKDYRWKDNFEDGSWHQISFEFKI